jgi:hypothetical protein
MDIDGESYIAIIIGFGTDGAVIVDRKIEIREQSKKELHFTSKAREFLGSLTIYYIY